MNHFFYTRIHCLFKVGDNRCKLVSGQTLVTGWTGEIGFLEPIQRLIDRFVTIWTVQGYIWLCIHSFALLEICGSLKLGRVTRDEVREDLIPVTVSDHGSRITDKSNCLNETTIFN